MISKIWVLIQSQGQVAMSNVFIFVPSDHKLVAKIQDFRGVRQIKALKNLESCCKHDMPFSSHKHKTHDAHFGCRFSEGVPRLYVSDEINTIKFFVCISKAL